MGQTVAELTPEQPETLLLTPRGGWLAHAVIASEFADHEQTYPVGGSCPECDLEEARELAKRWAWWHAFDTAEHAQAESNADLEEWLASIGEAERPLDDAERERLFAWVRERMAAEGDTSGRADPKLHLSQVVGFALDLDDEILSHAEYLDRCWALCEAAGWTS